LSSNEDNAKKHLANSFILKGNGYSDKKNYTAAKDCYEKAIKLNPKNEVAYMNLGNSLSQIAKTKNNPNLYEQCNECYKKACKIAPRNVDIYTNWGSSLAGFAELIPNAELFKESLEKYEKVIEINPKDSFARDNTVGVLLLYSKTLTDKKEVLEDAKKRALFNYNTFHRSYNLACVYSLLEDKTNALKFLIESLNTNQINVEHVKKDNDWDNYKTDPDFIKILLEINLNS
jgi:tetratricopeptide (TPR) repeat protein